MDLLIRSGVEPVETGSVRRIPRLRYRPSIVSQNTWSAVGPNADEFFFRTNLEQVNTKRGILSVMTRVYDPLGFLAPVLMTAKIIQREIW